jgi:UDP-N-acetylmuramoyl-L-alanyl-D-glutamate--2,6-diaminopimelate ligase
MIKIEELFKKIPCELVNMKPDLHVKGLSSDSRVVKRGELFIAVKGCQQNGHDYIRNALKKGAVAVCSERRIKGLHKTGFVIVKSTAKVLPILSSRFFGEPSKYLKLIGITGTDGKTTTSHLVYEILKAAKKSPSLLGSIQYRLQNKAINSYNTTPGPVSLHSLFSKMREGGSDYAVMEVSSHGLKQARVSGLDFSVAAFTNITGDHLDYHRTMGDYVRSKRFLFESLKKKSTAVLNMDDRYYNEFKKATRARIISYGIANPALIRASHIEMDINGTRFFIDTPKGTISVRTPLIGRHNIYNVLAAAAISFAEGVTLDNMTEAMGRFKYVRGRLELIDVGQRFKVFIDYAHTHDALKNILSSLKELCSGKIVVVFGCGGNRDRTKRAKMGRIASDIADYVIVTNDNPRNEDPNIILDEIEKGFRRNFTAYKRIPDRFKAIKMSLTGRDAADIVVIAGKGHEDYQIIKGRKYPFNDRKAVKKILSTNMHPGGVHPRGAY